jgi:replicative DNA helicase
LELLNCKNIKTDRITILRQELEILHEHIENNKTFEITTTGLLTGITMFDKHTGGLQGTDLIVIAGETSHGKTSLAMQMLLGACRNPYTKAVVYSLEMSNQQLSARLLANESGLDYKTILFSKISDYDTDTANNAINSLSGVNIYFDAGANSDIISIVNSIHALKIKYDINVAVVDYLQRIAFKNTRYKTDEQIDEVCKLLKATAGELNIPIILVSQFSREESRTHKYTLASLKGSSGIEQNADIVIFIQRPEIFGQQFFEHPFDSIETKDKAIIKVEKGRNYGLTSFVLNFDATVNRFTNYHNEI